MSIASILNATTLGFTVPSIRFLATPSATYSSCSLFCPRWHAVRKTTSSWQSEASLRLHPEKKLSDEKCWWPAVRGENTQCEKMVVHIVGSHWLANAKLLPTYNNPKKKKKQLAKEVDSLTVTLGSFWALITASAVSADNFFLFFFLMCGSWADMRLKRRLIRFIINILIKIGSFFFFKPFKRSWNKIRWKKIHKCRKERDAAPSRSPCTG